jgi:hypothetical protein
MQGIIIFVHKHVLEGANQYVKGNKQRAMGQYMGLIFGIVLILVNRMGSVNMEEGSYMRGRGLILRGIQYIKQLDENNSVNNSIYCP